ncbi:cytochrome P450 85A [Morus notabilis]|uniref:cytochrome P450 85A n=1 Tax=Morus notabilis TaxID=981085 RepID=UPI000CED4B99|nr:cytochrome P450 85A [Morus notabilis]
MMLPLVFGLSFGVLFSVICFALLKWNALRYNLAGKGLPPGTMGWPVFGETTEFLKHGLDFLNNKKAMYGNVFKTHIFGSPTIICMDPDLNRYILLNEGKGLVPGYPQSMVNILGKSNIAAVYGSSHKHIRGSLLSLVGPPAIRDLLLPNIDKYMRFFLLNWDGKTIDIQTKTVEMAFFAFFKQILEDESSTIYESFKAEFHKILVGAFTLPINIPGTSYYQGMQGRRSIERLLMQIMEERRASGSQNDMLDRILRDEENNHNLIDEEIIDQIITILYSSFETVSTTSMMAIKYLHDNPRALQELREEHLAIRRRKKEEEPIIWDDYKKSMSFTRAVIFETSRLACVVCGMMRKIASDMDLNGFVFPKGWKVYLFTRETNFNPFLYPEPFTFNPWRWLQNKSLESHKYCLFFGGGSRLCPGKELGIVQISVFLHYFLTKYRWEEVGEHEILKFPRVEAPRGLHIKVFKY